MSRTYKATGINLKGMPIGEADRLVTILTPEFGLVRAVAPGARKYKSKLRGRSELFVVNQLLIAKGRSLDKITQAETLETYLGLSRDLGKLAAGQYLAELVLSLALSEQPQQEIYFLLKEHLRRLEQLPNTEADANSKSRLSAHLAQAVFHLLALAGVAPQVHACCLESNPIEPNLRFPNWRVGFSFNAGGIINLSSSKLSAESTDSQVSYTEINTKLDGLELTLLQKLGDKLLPQNSEILLLEDIDSSIASAWIKIERLLRNYAQYYFGRSIRSAALVDSLYS